MYKYQFALTFILSLTALALFGQNPIPVKPRVLISTDIGGTDPDDNQSMIHLLMYSDKFDLEGLVSSPSFGEGSKEEILRTIDLYEKDLPKLKKHNKRLSSPAYLRSITKQGRKGGAPYLGYANATEGSDWIVKKAREKSDRPLWVLVWGGLEDLAQALHDAPDIQNKIKVYWIGGPNKKWSTNSYAYIAQNFPALWFIESNATYRGFFSNTGVPDKLNSKNYFANYIRDAGHLGKDFKNNRYEGNVKMGDTPSLLYLMDGDPNNPMRDNWGGSYEKFSHSPRIVYHRNTTLTDTVAVYSIVEFHFKGPEVTIPADSACFTMTTGNQTWDGFYLGSGNYAVRYAPKQTETLTYNVTSTIPGFQEQSGAFVVNNIWPGKQHPTDYQLGENWFTDKAAPELYDGIWQGAKTTLKWRNDVLLDWAKRWKWLSEK
ncbi:nucleoside hydrolase-like domain-containing protein [Botryobacter ruber]|uniref:nucleoside hydrolase-like domain-containing protein n=1 Tax=Botryobacter ruber TaxID=2171629 RepID=UPI000E0AC11D|nr:nucleoside hydrolase-like domain-containing protein [Botryobacter ruber]